MSRPDPGDDIAPGSCCEGVRRLAEYWEHIRPAGRLPGRQHLDPLDIPDLLANLWLVDVHRSPWRFRVRLIGTAIVSFVGADHTGQWMHEVFPGFEKTGAYRDLVACAADGRPVARTARLVSNPERTYVRAQRIHLPLAADGRTPDMILSLTQYLNTLED